MIMYAATRSARPMILTPCPYDPNNDYVCSNTKCPAYDTNTMPLWP